MQATKEPKRVFFPQDETEHNHIIEWWYFNGNLQDRKGNSYAFMNCLLKADVKRVKLPILSDLPIPVKTMHFSHSLLSDLNRMKFHPSINYVVRLSNDSFRKPRLFAKYGDCLIKKTGESEYRVVNDQINLKMISMKRPLLEAGRGFFELPNRRSTYYYSLTNLKTEGTITIHGKRIRVRGKSWMDHQWANNVYNRDRWIWFSIQLDNNMEIVCFEYGKRKRQTMACIMDSRGRQENTSRLRLIPTGKTWTSPNTKAIYPLSWRIEIPSKGISLEVEPLIRNQEMLFGLINYWEGPLAVRGKIRGKRVRGKGFLELMGYKPRCSLPKLIKEGFEKAVMQEFERVKEKVEEILD